MDPLSKVPAILFTRVLFPTLLFPTIVTIGSLLAEFEFFSKAEFENKFIFVEINPEPF